jgi:hypothetical protein
MTDFPTILYKCPGPWPGNGYSFATRPADDEAQYEAAVSDGWHPTVPLAVEAWRKPAPVVSPQPSPIPVQVPADDAPPTREEIEAKAKELGITVHHKHSDATLLKKIEEAIEERSGGVEQG